MPFIRYDTGDVVALDRSACNCERESPMIGSVEGRMVDAITAPDGRRVEAFDLCAEFEEFPEVDQFQFRQLRDGTYRISIVSASGDMDRIEERIVRRFKRILGTSASVLVRHVERIPPQPSGKTPPIQRES
jgi:phenylacetate-coenzyme A ligase PaaK-like adenylate-forming protein